jgi:acyl-coenzyme A synthetase/AMP-(fatty) acid ligase
MSSAQWRRPTKFTLGDVFVKEAVRVPYLPIRMSRPMTLAPALGTSVTLRDFARLVEETAARLHAVGVQPRDRVAIVKTPSPDVSIVQQAVARIGGVAAMLWPYSEPDVLGELLTRLDRPYVITDDDVRDNRLNVLDLAELTRGVLTVRGSGDLDVELYRPPAPERPLQLPDGVVLVTHSSGTTGVPKLIAFDDAAVGAHTELQVRVAAALRIRGPVAFCLSYFHNRMPSALATAARRDAAMLLLDEPDPATAATLLADFRPAVVETFPNVFVEWEDITEHPRAPFADVRCFVNTFDAIHPRTIQRLLDASGRRHPLYIQAYGSTETGPLAVRIHTRRGIRSADARCVGYPIPGFTRNRLEPRPSTEDAMHRRGEIVVRARGAAVTYVNERERTAPGSPRAWWGTGDLGQRGRWGCLHLLDRIVDESPQLNSNLAVEDLLLLRLPQLSEALVLPAPHNGPPVPVVCTRRDAPLDGAAWADAVADLPSLAAPLHVPWDAVPRGSTWKVRRLELRRQLAAGTVATVAASHTGLGAR